MDNRDIDLVLIVGILRISTYVYNDLNYSRVTNTH